MAEPREEVHAMMGVLLDASPESRRYPVDQAQQLDDPYQVVADSTEIWSVVKLELLRQAISGGVAIEQTMKLSRSLVRSGDDQSADRLVTAISRSLAHPDPLGRTTPSGPYREDVEDLLSDLVPAVNQNVMMLKPNCGVEDLEINGRPVMSIYASIVSADPVAAFYDVIDPKRWVNCPLTHQFFRRMDSQNPSDAQAHQPPDAGYVETITETVDFSLGLGLKAAMMETNLNVVFIDDTQRSSLSPALSATYDLASSVDGKIVFDRGFLIAEADTLTGYTTLQTLKQVWFADFALPDLVVCPVWSVMTMLLTVNCAQP